MKNECHRVSVPSMMQQVCLLLLRVSPCLPPSICPYLSDRPANHRDQWLGVDLPKWSYTRQHPSIPRPNALHCLFSIHLSIYPFRLASMHIHQLSRASWPAKRARPHSPAPDSQHHHTQTHTPTGPGKQTSHSPVVHRMWPDCVKVMVLFKTSSFGDKSRTSHLYQSWRTDRWTQRGKGGQMHFFTITTVESSIHIHNVFEARQKRTFQNAQVSQICGN